MVFYRPQTGEYFILAMIMFGASMIFVLLSIFYYDHIPKDSFVNDGKQEDEIKNEEKTSRKSVLDPQKSIKMDNIEKKQESGKAHDAFDNKEADL